VTLVSSSDAACRFGRKNKPIAARRQGAMPSRYALLCGVWVEIWVGITGSRPAPDEAPEGTVSRKKALTPFPMAHSELFHGTSRWLVAWGLGLCRSVRIP
jgi:hypothetical protein